MGDQLSPKARANTVVGLFAGVPALAIGVLLLVTVGVVPGVVAFVVVGLALAAWGRLSPDRLAATRIGGRAPDPEADARLINLVEGLSISAGLRQPTLRVVHSEGLNAVAAGTSSSKAVLAVTTGLLSELERIELEAVLAEMLMQIRRDETLPLTVLVATLGIGTRIAVPGDRDAEADREAIGLTRYPPALAAALDKIDSKGSAVEGQGRLTYLWLADPTAAGSPRRGRLDLSERVQALREL